MSKRRRRIEEDPEEDGGNEQQFAVPNEVNVSAPKKTKISRNSSSAAEPDETDEEAGPSEVDCSQNPDFQTGISGPEVGLIEKVTLINFMCHTHLEVNFGSNVNFVIGRNGSGKSAIMTAIVVGLGSKATSTSRGNSLKGFIQNKCSSALISIKLRNCGKDAYRPDAYGKAIIVERKINHDGTGHYKLKSCDGKRVVSSKKEELNNILDQFNIQVDNPVSVLNQDTSRNFLCSANPGDKYKFFLKATQLEQMSNDYQMILEQKTIAKNTLVRKTQTMPEMEQELFKLEEKYKDIAQIKELQNTVDQRMNEIAWAQVYEVEKKIPPLEKEVRKYEASVPRHDEKITTCHENITKLEQEWEVHQQKLNEIGEEGKGLQRSQEEINAELKQKRGVLKDKQSQMRKVRHELQANKSDRKQLLDRIAEIRKSAMQDQEAERQRREADLNMKKEELKALKAQFSTTNHHRGQLELAISKAKEQDYTLGTETGDLKRHLDSANRRLQDLKGSRENKLKVFGSWVPTLLGRIEDAMRRNRFHQPPKGPIGSLIKVKDEKWALAVEGALKGIAWAFCCHDFHDAQVLKTLLKQVCPPTNFPQIIVSKFVEQVFDVSRNRPQCKYPTVLEMLDIQDPVVANCLIDQTGLERILLIEDPKEARQFMFQRNLPKNVRIGYDIKGDQLIGGTSAKQYSNYKDQTVYLKGNVENEIWNQEQQIEQLRHDLDKAKTAQHEVRAEIDRNRKEFDRAKRKAMQEQDGLNKLQLDVEELESYEEEQLPDVTTLEEEVTYYDSQNDELEQKNGKAQEEFETAQEAVQKQELKSRQHKEKIQALLEKTDPLKNQLHGIEVEIATQKAHRKHYEDKKKEHMEKLDKIHKEHETVVKKAEDMTGEASLICERVETNRKVSDLEKEINQYQRRIKAEEKNKGKHEEVTMQFYEAKQRYLNIRDNMKSLKGFAKRLDKIMEHRSTAFVNYRHFIAIRAKYFFQMMLSQRGYTGKMRFDHKTETLTLHVNVESGGGKGSKDTKSLSGGERSFSTVSFIMALWEAMESPFRCLDEFDVFMDMVNRRISMDMMLKVATEQSTRQFIFLTPQDMSRVGGGSNVRIFQLADPDRGQTTLPFQPT